MMDPQTTWNALLEEWTQCNWLDVLELAEALLEWLSKFGYPPETIEGRRMGADWNRVLATAVCEFAVRRANNVLDSPHQIPTEVSFTLSCYSCNNEGPRALSDAIAQGWCHLRYTPAGMSENVLGHCPYCQSVEANEPSAPYQLG